MKKNKISLLPYTREELYGLSSSDPQFFGWEIVKFNIQKYWNTTKGENVKIAVIDTGCDYNHPDLKNNILDGGYNFVNNNNDPMDDNGHGTHVSSTIAAENNGYGLVGVAPKSKILPIKALDARGGGDLQNVIKAIIFAADKNMDLITMSLGSSSPATALEDAIKYAAAKGCIVYCAAGNSGPSVDIMYPAKYDYTIAIGAIDENLNRTNFTCSGDSLDFLAPGHNIMGCIPNNKYATMSGTSMSNPFAVGCAALLLSYNKKNKKYKLDNYNDYVSLFKSQAISINQDNFKTKKYQGYGIINIGSLII